MNHANIVLIVYTCRLYGCIFSGSIVVIMYEFMFDDFVLRGCIHDWILLGCVYVCFKVSIRSRSITIYHENRK